ncbi:unnamed protein product [Soboliphyme baturini]|uniref:Myosin_tail_1 domain-containing protein n=1 Tax=Soboliphyme baturini TaxID=241478 RepID=A0A183J3D8_9BILA|nr:unnamed protein product [Soboliphyme baturini]
MSASVFRSSSANLIKSASAMSRSGLGELGFAYPGFGGATMSVADLGSLTRLEDKIRLLQDDLESERELRNRIERERADLSVQLINLTDRLEDAEGSTDAQIEANRKREGELAKLRKLLEDAQVENEDSMNILRKKHQEALLDYQQQIEGLQKKNTKYIASYLTHAHVSEAFSSFCYTYLKKPHTT